MRSLLLRKINWVLVHCSDSDHSEHDDIKVIESWHLQRGWKKVGYHYFIRKDGTIENGRDEAEVGAHVKNHNKDSIGICLHGKEKERFTPAQFNSLEILLIDILSRHGLDKGDILGHKDLDPGKTCPNFDLDSWLKTREWS